MKKLALIALTAVCCGVGIPAIAGDSGNDTTALPGDAIKQLFPGNFEAEVKGYDMLITGSTDGMLKGKAFHRRDRGRWWVKDDSLCVAWKNWTDGEPVCGAITQEGDWFFSQNEKGEGMKFRKVREFAAVRSTRSRRADELGNK